MPRQAQHPGESDVRIDVARDAINATLNLPPDPHGIVLFAHGSGSSRFSRRNRAVAAALQRAHFATLLADLLTQAEELRDVATGEYRFDIPLLAKRVVAATDWLKTDTRTAPLPIGYFGASTGAAAALVAAAERPDAVRGIVSRGGRPDLAGDALDHVRAPTLLIVGEHDAEVLQLNRMAQRRLRAPSKIEIVSGATHLFEEPGALDEVAALASAWFTTHLDAHSVLDRTTVGW